MIDMVSKKYVEDSVREVNNIEEFEHITSWTTYSSQKFKLMSENKFNIISQINLNPFSLNQFINICK